MTARREFARDALHLFGLCGLALAQPLYDLIGRHAEFLVAHRAGPRTIFIFVAALSLGTPALLVLVELLAAAADRRTRRAVHLVLVFVLLLAFASALTVKAALAAASGIAIATAAALGVALAYARIAVVQRFFTVFAVAAVAFPALFLASGPVSRLAFPRPVPVEGLSRAPDSPVVFVMFDELSTFALLDEHGNIDAARYPAFGMLAKTSWWFPNAMATASFTEAAVPSVLTGRIANDRERRIPIAADYPQNLFTWLGSAYRMHVMEPLTALCPSSVCNQGVALPPPDTRVFSSDLAILYAHLVLPAALAAKVAPPIGTTWTDFGAAAVTPVTVTAEKRDFKIGHEFDRALERGRAEMFREFVSGIDAADRRVLHYVHVSLPHQPLAYLPSGRLMFRGTPPAEGLGDDDVWSQEEALVLTGAQQYQLQVAFTDRLLGELLAKLRATGIYDKALIVVTSDHGAAFERGQTHRARMNGANYKGVAAVPLFVKLPHQREPRIDARFALGTDILPTIGMVLGSPLPWPVDGHALLGDDAEGGARWSERAQTALPLGRPGDRLMPFDVRNEALTPERLRWRRLLIAEESLPDLPRSLVGTHVGAGGATDRSLRVLSDSYLALGRVDPSSGIVPALIKGQVDGDGPAQIELAIAVNGVIRAVTRTAPWRNAGRYFAAIVPEESLQRGHNTLEVFRLDRGDPRQLVRVPASLGTGLTWGIRDAFIATPDGRRLALGPDILSSVDRVEVLPNSLLVLGWAVDFKTKSALDSIVAFAGPSMIASAPLTVSRPDVCAALGLPADLKAGFVLELPLGRLHAGEIRLAAISARGAAAGMPLGATAEVLARYR